MNSCRSLYSAHFFLKKKINVKSMKLSSCCAQCERGNENLEGKAVVMAAEIIFNLDLLFRCCFHVSYFNLERNLCII